MNTDAILIVKEIIELLTTLFLCLVTAVSATIAIMAYRIQVKSILINQWTTFKMLLENQQQSFNSLILDMSSSTDNVNEEVRSETIKRTQDRINELNADISVLEKKLNLK